MKIDFKSLLRDYNSRGRVRNQAEIAWFQRQPSMAAAIDLACRSEDEDGKRYSHQRRIRKTAIEAARRILLQSLNEIENCKTFESLLDVITEKLATTKYVRELYCYDVAFRIGAKLKLFPTKVHLHAGTRDGAKNFGLNYRAKYLDKSEVPRQLQHLLPHEIEDCLCIYKDGRLRQRGCTFVRLQC